jgi:hypothetical protein
MQQRDKLVHVLDLLKTSVDSNLNAALTPDDCRLILTVIANAHRQSNGPLRIDKTTPPASRSSPVEKIVSGMADIAHGVIEDLAGDLTPRRTARHRRRKQ